MQNVNCVETHFKSHVDFNIVQYSVTNESIEQQSISFPT
jgi:hypothetical protein